MSKKLFIIFSVVILLVGGLFVACEEEVITNGDGNGNGEPPPPVVYEANFQIFHNRLQRIVQEVHIPWAERLEERSDGRLKINIHDFGAISGEVTSALESNLIQIAIFAPFLEPGQHVLCESIIGAPMLAPNATVASLVQQHLFDTFPEMQAEFSPDIKVAGWFCASPFQLNAQKPVHSLADIEGLKVLALGADQVMIWEAFGAVPQTIALTGPSDIYMALERGMVEALFFDNTSAYANQIHEVCSHTTLCDVSTGAMYLAFSREWYDSLPQDLQELLDEESGMAFAEWNGQSQDEDTIIDGLNMKDAGVVFYLLPSTERDIWGEILQEQVWEVTLADLEAQGFNARLIWDEAVRYVEEIVDEYEEVDYSELLD